MLFFKLDQDFSDFQYSFGLHFWTKIDICDEAAHGLGRQVVDNWISKWAHYSYYIIMDNNYLVFTHSNSPLIN